MQSACVQFTRIWLEQVLRSRQLLRRSTPMIPGYMAQIQSCLVAKICHMPMLSVESQSRVSCKTVNVGVSIIIIEGHIRIDKKGSRCPACLLASLQILSGRQGAYRFLGVPVAVSGLQTAIVRSMEADSRQGLLSLHVSFMGCQATE